MAERFDLVVIGAGPGGYVAAIRAAQLGLKVACVEKRATLGGTCLNVGCIPSKALLESSELYVMAKNDFARHGIQTASISLDLAAMLQRKEKVVKTLTSGVPQLFKNNKITTVYGTARLVEATKVVVQKADGATEELEAKSVLLATGSEPTALPKVPFDGVTILSSTEALSLDKVPEELIVIGAGYIGLELGSVWNRLGSKVTVVEFLPRILPLTDTEIANLVKKSLEKQGLTFHLETKVLDAVIQDGKVILQADSKGAQVSFRGDKVLVAVGRRPLTSGLGLEALGVAVDERTRQIKVDDKYRTNVPGVYAIGDLIHGPMLAHKAHEEGVAVAELLAGRAAHVNYNAIPSVIYIHPEVASVGLTEEQVKETGKPYRTGKFPFLANGRALSLGESDGLVKVLADGATDRILGVHIFGARASELIAEATVALEFVASAEDIACISHAHPTMSEAVGQAARAAFAGKAIDF
jgi:dihydrolipoamide dehydrogenase